MRISISTLGTRGDVQPYVALALGLIRRGHEVQLAAPEQFADLIAGHKVALAPLPGDFLALLDTPEGKAAVAGGQGFSGGLKLLKHVRPLMRRLLDAEWLATQRFNPDLLLYHPKSIATPHMAERLGLPAVLASPLPGFTPTAAFSSPMLPFTSLGLLNKMSHQLAIRGGAALFGKILRTWRAETLELPAPSAGSKPAATLYAYSPHVVPVPDDWGANVKVTGYWFLDEPHWAPSPALQHFLATGDKPVYVGFGSMPGLDPVQLAREVITALAHLGRRGILATGGGALRVEQPPPHVHVLEAAPHDRLLPLTSAAVHHGGAGTTAAAVRAGVPMAICPFLGDQPFWGRRATSLGIAPAQLDRRRLNAESLAAAISATADSDMQQRAARLSELVRAEAGVDTAVARIEAIAHR